MAEQQKCKKKLVAVLVEHQEYFGKMPNPDCQWVIQNPKDAIAIFVKAVKNRTKNATKPPKPTILRFHEETSVGPLSQQFVPNEFFRTREGLYLWNEMQRVLKNAKTVNPAETAATKLRSFDLTKNAYDREIKAELPKQHEVDLWQIAELIGKQKNGEAGPLLTNGRANIFYVSGFAVVVRWHAVSRKWNVLDWKPDDGDWVEGGRVFSCN